MKQKHTTAKIIAASLLATLTSNGALVYNELWTDGTGSFGGTGVSWSGPASEVQANAGVDPATAPTAATPPTTPLLSNTSGGTLSLGASTGFGTNPNGAAGTLVLTLASGTADLNVTNNFATSIFGVYGVNNFSIADLQRAGDSFTLSFNWDAPLAATGNVFNQQPFLAAFQAVGSNVTVSYTGISSSTDGINFTTGLPGTAVGDTLSTGVTFATGATSGSNTNTDGWWQGLNGFDLDGGGFDVATEADKLYTTGITFNVSRADGLDFDGTEQYLFSTNGTTYANLANVPEPSTGMLGALSCLTFLMRRKR